MGQFVTYLDLGVRIRLGWDSNSHTGRRGTEPHGQPPHPHWPESPLAQVARTALSSLSLNEHLLPPWLDRLDSCPEQDA